jgi:hypothetical protein
MPTLMQLIEQWPTIPAEQNVSGAQVINRRAPTCNAAHLSPSPSSARPFASSPATPPQVFNSALQSASSAACILIPPPMTHLTLPFNTEFSSSSVATRCINPASKRAHERMHGMTLAAGCHLLTQSTLRGETRLQERGKLKRHCGGH